MILYGPETKIKPDSNAFKQTTRFPLNRPARRIRTVPGVIDLRILGGCCFNFVLYCILMIIYSIFVIIFLQVGRF